ASGARGRSRGPRAPPAATPASGRASSRAVTGVMRRKGTASGGERLDRRGLVFEDLEHGDQLRDLEDVLELRRQVEQLQFAAAVADRCVTGDQLADAGRVDGRDLGGVQEDVRAAVLHGLVDRLANGGITRADREFALQVQDRDPVPLPRFHFHEFSPCKVLLRRSPPAMRLRNVSTVPPPGRKPYSTWSMKLFM